VVRFTLVRLYFDIETFGRDERSAFLNEKIILVGIMRDETAFNMESLRQEPETILFPNHEFEPEDRILTDTLAFLEQMRSSRRFVDVVGFNLLRFDFPLMIARVAEGKVRDVSSISALLHNYYCVDHLQLLLPANQRMFKGVKLETIVKKANELKLSPAPPEPYGSNKQIKQLYDDKRHDEIAKHCTADLRIVRWLDLFGTRELLKIATSTGKALFLEDQIS
jgi:hypothetical protein